MPSVEIPSSRYMRLEMEIEMPNLCYNTLKVYGPEQDIQEFKTKAVGHHPWGKDEDEPNVLNFHNLFPFPADVLKAGYKEAGFDWECENWGSKWGSFDCILVDDFENYLTYEFHTAWCPPIKFLNHVAKEHPELTFFLTYEEDQCQGLAKFEGDKTEHHCIDY